MKNILIVILLIYSQQSFSQCNSSLKIDSTVVSGSNCIIYMTFCSESGGHTNDLTENTGAFGFVFFGDPNDGAFPSNQNIVVDFSSSITADSTESIYTGVDYWNNTTEIALEFLYGSEADGFIGFSDPDPGPPSSKFDWFLCKHDSTLCGDSGVSCSQFVVELSETPDSISLVGIEGALSTATDLIDALINNEPIGCPDLTVYPQPCGINPLAAIDFVLKGYKVAKKNKLEWTVDENVDYFNILKSDGVNPFEIIGTSVVSEYSDFEIGYKDYYKIESVHNNRIISNTIRIERRDLFQIISLYPNPTTDRLTIELSRSPNSNLTITSALGKVIVEDYISTPRKDIDVSGLSNGIYFISIGEVNQKFIKE